MDEPSFASGKKAGMALEKSHARVSMEREKNGKVRRLVGALALPL
jgi:hypothetical protein